VANHRGQEIVAHCLNQRSAQRLGDLRDLGVRPIVSCNTAQPRPHAALAEASQPATASIFYCGRADRSKNLEGLLEAWSLITTDRSLNLFGPEQLQRFASREQRVVYGGCYEGDPPFRLGDVVVLPSFREGHANVLVEAFRAGAVVVGSAVPGVEEHLANDQGIVIGRPLGARSIAAAIVSAVTLPPEQRARIGLRARSYFDSNFASPYSSAINVMRLVLNA
jgi:glycosyltransferase involved in cell wall biosynthesis